MPEECTASLVVLDGFISDFTDPHPKSFQEYFLLLRKFLPQEKK